jgi:signal transduction histidine kinase
VHTPRTLRGRLAIAAAASILLAVVVFAVVTVALVDHQLSASLDSALRQRAQAVAQLAVSAPAVLTYPGALEGSDSGRQLAVEVIDARGRIVARSLTLGAQLLPQDRLAMAARRQGQTGIENIELDGRPFRMYAAPIAQAGGPAAGGAVLVASDTSDIRQTISSLGLAIGLSGAGVALLAAIAAAVLTRRGLRPLRRLAVAAGEIERTADPSRRLPDAAARDEIGQLTGVLNRMLSSLEEARAGERRFLADASHELRTPVTSLMGNVEYASRHGADAELLDELHHDAARLARLVDALLTLERADEGSPAATQIELDELVRAAMAEHDGQRVKAGPLAAATVRGDEPALRRAVSNLIDNGLVHGPADGMVTVSLEAANGLARLTVCDQGAGPDPADSEHLFERFWRGAQAVARPGSGLGLSIVAAIVEGHGGQVSVKDSAFTVELPLADE